MYVIVVCHTEPGFTDGKKIFYKVNPNHKMSADQEALGLEGGVPCLIETAEKHGAKVCFAVSPESLVHISRGLRGEMKRHEIGLHMHPVDTKLISMGVSDKRSRALSDYSLKEQESMIKTGKLLVRKKFGREPKVFVAGNWSIGNETVTALQRCGLKTDCSANPGFVCDSCDWSGMSRFQAPYQPSTSSYKSGGGKGLVEVPISKILTGASISPESRGVGLGFLNAGMKEFQKNNMPVLHISLHSPCMTSPMYVKLMDRMLSFAAGLKGAEFTLPENITTTGETRATKKIWPYMAGINGTLVKNVLTGK